MRSATSADSVLDRLPVGLLRQEILMLDARLEPAGSVAERAAARPRESLVRR